MDDANNKIYDIELVKEEDSITCMKLIHNIVENNGIFIYRLSAKKNFHQKIRAFPTACVRQAVNMFPTGVGIYRTKLQKIL